MRKQRGKIALEPGAADLGWLARRRWTRGWITRSLVVVLLMAMLLVGASGVTTTTPAEASHTSCSVSAMKPYYRSYGNGEYQVWPRVYLSVTNGTTCHYSVYVEFALHERNHSTAGWIVHPIWRGDIWEEGAHYGHPVYLDCKDYTWPYAEFRTGLKNATGGWNRSAALYLC